MRRVQCSLLLWFAVLWLDCRDEEVVCLARTMFKLLFPSIIFGVIYKKYRSVPSMQVLVSPLAKADP